MKFLLYFSALVVFFGSAFAGSNDAFITGKSASGRTEIKIAVQDIHGSINEIDFAIDGETLKFARLEQESNVVDKKLGVLVLTAQDEQGNQLTFYAIPKTLAVAKEGPHSSEWKFDAYIIATDPRKEKEGEMSKKIRLKCVLDYSI